MLRRHTRNRRGFTMTELLVVLTIIVLIASVYMPRYRAARGSAAYAACQENLKSLANASQLYANDNYQVYQTSLSQLVPQYLGIIPTCPNALADTYSPSYSKIDGSPTLFTIFCMGSNHFDAIEGVPNQPYYIFGVGLGP